MWSAQPWSCTPASAQQVRAAQRLTDLDAVHARAAEILERLDRADL
jgi:hypothetical protein